MEDPSMREGIFTYIWDILSIYLEGIFTYVTSYRKKINKPKLLYLSFFYCFGIQQNSVEFKTNRKMVNTIRFQFIEQKSEVDFCVCIVHSHTPLNNARL